MTEFAQKVNYQRALQGEITRTILALSEIRDARVHLALPDEGLFKRTTAKGKASVTLHLQPGRTLRPEQIAGIQRLVSASVTGVATQDVTIVDHQGVVLSRVAADVLGGDQEGGSARLDLKKNTEQILSRKVSEVLDKAFGTGQALASVDVTLNMDQLRVTTEEVLANPTRMGRSATGVVVREREVLREAVPSPDLRSGDAGVARGGYSQREVDYQVGKRVEQLTSVPGAIRRIQVVAIVRRSLDTAQIEQLRVLVSAAVGAISERGDQVVVQSLAGLGATAGQPTTIPTTKEEHIEPDPAASVSTTSHNLGDARSEVASRGDAAIVVSLSLLLLAVLTCGFTWALSRRRRSMTSVQREAALARVKAWLADGGEADALHG
jgi:flagellar M-ring protein FliF